MTRARIVLGLSLGIMMGGAAMAADWPQWRGADRNANDADFKAPATWPKELTAKWKVNVGSGSDSSPALVGGKLFVLAREGDDETIVCLDAGKGTELWRYKYPTAAISGPDARGHAGPRSSPAVADGKVVALGINGMVTCLNAADGKMIWQKDSAKDGLPRFHTACSPMIMDGLAIVQLGSSASGAIVAYDLGTGNEKWKAKCDGAAYASPEVLNVDGVKVIVTLSEKGVVAVKAADGAEVWKADFAPKGMGSYNAVPPVVHGSVVIYTGAGRGTKAVKFEKNGDAISAKELWTNPDISAAFCTPVLRDGHLFGLSAGAGGRNSGGGKFYCIDAKNGKTDWTDSVVRGTDYGAIINAGPVIIALTSTGQLMVIDPNDKAYKELASLKVSDKATYGYPVMSGNTLFVRDEGSLAMYELQ